MNKKELKVIISLINMFQFDGASWTVDGIKLNDLSKKLKNEIESQPDKLGSYFSKK